MVRINRDLYDRLLSQIKSGGEKSSVLHIILDENYTMLEAEAIYDKVLAISLADKEVKKKKIAHWKRELKKPVYSVFGFSALLGILGSFLYLTMFSEVFSFFWGIPWMVYIIGKWFFCLLTGNIPAFFANEQGVMVSACKEIGTNNDVMLAIQGFGGYIFTMIIGFLLVVFMIKQVKKYYWSRDVSDQVKRHKYFAGWVNGTIGFSCLTAMTYALAINLNGETRFDLVRIEGVFGFQAQQLFLSIACIAWIVTIVLSIVYLRKHHRYIVL